MTKRTTAAVWVKGIADMLAAEGLERARLLLAAGIDPASLDAPGARLPTEKISRLWELAVERSGNPALGLAQHQVVRPASFDVVGYTMMSCAGPARRLRAPGALPAHSQRRADHDGERRARADTG